MQIFANTLTGETITICVCGADKIGKVKADIQNKDATQPSRQRIVFGGTILEEWRTISECKIQKESTLHMVSSLRGGMPQPVVRARAEAGASTGSNPQTCWHLTLQGITKPATCSECQQRISAGTVRMQQVGKSRARFRHLACRANGCAWEHLKGVGDLPDIDQKHIRAEFGVRAPPQPGRDAE